MHFLNIVFHQGIINLWEQTTDKESVEANWAAVATRDLNMAEEKAKRNKKPLKDLLNVLMIKII